MDSWKCFDETSLPDKEAFYSSLNMEEIIDVDCRHAKRVFKNFNNKNLGDYHDLYVQSDTLLLADVFENFRNQCSFFTCTWIRMASLFKKTEVKLELLTNVDILLMVEKGIRGGICQATHRYAKSNKKYIKNYDKNEGSSTRRWF